MEFLADAHCLKCTTFRGKPPNRKVVPVSLICTTKNYSGCGVDMGYCPQCGKGYQVSYAVDEVIPAPEWDEEVSE